MPRIRIFDGDEVAFDSDNINHEQLDSERDHMVARPGWSISTPEQVERQIERPMPKDCDTCEGAGEFMSLGKLITCPTCLGGFKLYG